ncbi:MAG TPA: hypothetical protein PKE45_12580, partial [Caldilineaceae bacterium]|nr:hypothetical protein [Caldilineaceae bacterium]
PAGQAAETAYQVIASGRSLLTANLLLPYRVGGRYFTGNRVPIRAFISAQGPLGGLNPLAVVTAPDGSERNVPLFDDGQHDDGEANDGFYAGLYTAVNQANAVAPSGEEGEQPAPNDEGSYRVRLLVQGETFTREALDSFSVLAGADENADQLPDPYEQENNVVGNGADPDLDGADNGTEYQLGTDPQNSDSDGGGENDGSEFEKGKDPFNPQDDGIVAPQFLEVKPNVGANVVAYDVRPEYIRRILFRAETPNGPWNIHEQELPASGVYSDTASNGVTYFYRYMAIDGDTDRSAVIGSTGATPSDDPFAPEGLVVIDGDAPTTPDLDVVLSFRPYGEDEEAFAEITEMKLSNKPDLRDAEWQSFAQEAPWQLEPTAPGQEARVYARFRDAAHNESLSVLDNILVTEAQPPQHQLFLPLVGSGE